MIYALISIIAVILGVVVYLYLKMLDINRHSNLDNENSKEILKALRQAEKYSDKEAWVSIKWIDRDKYIHMGRTH